MCERETKSSEGSWVQCTLLNKCCLSRGLSDYRGGLATDLSTGPMPWDLGPVGGQVCHLDELLKGCREGRGQGQGAGTGKVVLDSLLRAVRSDVLARIISLMEKLCDPVIGSAPSPLTLKRGEKGKLHL